MPLPLLVKAIIVGGGAFGLYELFGSSSSTPSPSRPPFTLPVRMPGGALLPWDTVDKTLCLSFDAVGIGDPAALLNDLAHRLYPAVPSFPPVVGDHESVTQAYAALGGRVSDFVNAVKMGKLVCVPEQPDNGGDEGDDEGGNEVPDVDLPIESYFTGKPGGFVAIAQGDNPTSVIAKAYGIPASQTGAIRIAIGCVATVGYNIVFAGHKREGNDYGRGRTDGAWYDINWAFLPRNDDPRIAAAQGRKLTRWIGWTSGNEVEGSPGKFFPLWLPPLASLEGGGVACAPLGTFNPERNPPANVLAKLGWTLDELRAVYLNSPLKGPEA